MADLQFTLSEEKIQEVLFGDHGMAVELPRFGGSPALFVLEATEQMRG